MLWTGRSPRPRVQLGRLPGLLVLLVVLPQEAEGANRRNFLFGGQASTTGGALIARARDTDALFYNPAGLARTSSSSLNLSLTAFTLRFASIDAGFVVDAGSQRFTEDLTISEILPTPSALVYARPINPRWGYGFGIFVVQSSDSRLAAQVEEFGLTGPDGSFDLEAGLNQSGSSKTYNIGGGLGWKASDKLRLGGSLFVVYDRRVAFGQLFVSTGRGQPRVINASQDVKNAGMQGSFSLQWDASPAWSFGLIAKSPVLSIFTWGDIESLASLPDTDLVTDVETISEFNVQIVESASLELMGLVELDEWRVGATIEVSPPIDQGGLLPRTVDALVNYRLGAQHVWSEHTTLGFGFFTDLAPDDEIDDILGQDVDYFAWTVGFETARPLNARKTIFFTTALGLSYAVGFGDVGAARIDQEGNFEILGRDSTFHEFGLNLASGVEF